jgi:hypothetical protein
VCFDLGLKRSFALLDPLEALQSQISLAWLSDQWRQYRSSAALPGSRNSQAVAVSQINSSGPAKASQIGNETDQLQFRNSWIQQGSVGETSTIVGQSLNKDSQPIIQDVECGPTHSEAQFLNGSSAEQLSLVEAGDAEQMIRNDLQARGWFSRYPFKHRLTGFL